MLVAFEYVWLSQVCLSIIILKMDVNILICISLPFKYKERKLKPREKILWEDGVFYFGQINYS